MGGYVYIYAYQMRNVLNLYTKQLNNKKKDVRQKQDNSEQVIDRLTISAAGKQKAIMEKITSDIVKKIFNNTLFNNTLSKTVEDNTSCPPQKNINSNLLIKETSHTKLVFNTIDNNNTKQRDTLEITGSDFVPVP